MQSESKAVVFTAPETVEMRPVRLRELEAGDVLIETFWSSVSAGTEKMLFEGKLSPMPMTDYPVIPGYETVGKIIDKGKDVADDCIGKFVYVSGSFGYVGVNAAFGGASQYIVSPYHKTTRLDVLQKESLHDAAVGLTLPLGATALHIIDLALVARKKVLILGQGVVGLLVAEFAQRFGAEKVIATDLSAFRLSKSVADVKIHTPHLSLFDALGGALVDVVIDCSGSMPAIEESLKQLRMSGTVVLGGFYERIDLSYYVPFMKEVRFLAAKQWALGDLERTLDIIATHNIDFKKLFTHQVSAWNGVAHAYRTAFYDQTCLKMVLNWQTD